MKSLAVILNQSSAIYMLGVIWVIQLIHYPSFSNISESAFQQFHNQHTSAMGLIVGPIMVIELLASIWLLNAEANMFSISNLIIVLGLWLLTFFVSVPLHNKLAVEQDFSVIQKLILTNWPRTVLWTLRALLSSYLTLRHFNP